MLHNTEKNCFYDTNDASNSRCWGGQFTLSMCSLKMPFIFKEETILSC